MADRVAMIKARLEQALSPARIDITDDSYMHVGHAGAASGGGHFSVIIVADKFSGKSMIERHRAVYLAVNDMMPSEIHALSIKAMTKEEAA